jgi:hypothetical protein
MGEVTTIGLDIAKSVRALIVTLLTARATAARA